jgi:parvulin-like peptidyl-prolyl isomerase
MREGIHTTLLDEKVAPYLEEWMGALVNSAEVEVTYPIMSAEIPSQFTAGTNGSFIAPDIGTVNGRTIQEGALFFHLLRQYGSDVIKSMIEEILFVQDGVNMGITMDESGTRQELLNIYDAETLAILDEAFGASTINRTFSRHLTALDVMGTKYQEIIDEQNLEVTDEEVTEYYLNNLPNWVVPEMVRFSIIICTTQEDAQAGRDRISAGESFEDVCRDVSIDEQTRAYGGDTGAPVQRGFFTGDSAIMEDTLFALPVGGVSQPFQIGQNWFVVKVTDKVEAYEPTLGETREDIMASLIQERVAPFLRAWRNQLWEAADIDITYPIYAEAE